MFSFYEVAWAQRKSIVCYIYFRQARLSNNPNADAFIRDELSKGRYDPAISKTCFEMLLELFGRTLKIELGDHDGQALKIENVC